ncbi:MAG: iron-sulfur cluster assembly scaffold protein [Anaerolineales bacterium]|nr:iron-sulfur cluster assembly scaffold protein [Anaerolineales bacterium]
MPTRQESIDFILDHYEHPRHRGALADASLVVRGGNPGCGDVLTFYLRLDAGGRVAAVSFEGEGCTISQAAASVMTEKVLGLSLAELTALPQDPLIEELGRDVVSTRIRCATLAVNILKTAEQQQRTAAARGAAPAPEVS